MTVLTLLADIAPDTYAYTRPFIQPAPLWDHWPWLLLPLALGISIVYKCVKCDRMARVPKEAGELFLIILLVMAAAGAGLVGLVKFLEREPTRPSQSRLIAPATPATRTAPSTT